MAGEADHDALTPDAVLAVVRAHSGDFGKREIARALRLDAQEKIALKKILRDLEDAGKIERQGRRAYVAADVAPKVAVVEFTGHDRDGDLVGRLASHVLDETGPLVRLAPGHGSGRGKDKALGIGDRALAKLQPVEDGVVEARVIKAFGREKTRLLGVVRFERGGARVQPIERGQRNEYVLPADESRRCEDGDLILFSSERGTQHGLKTARVIEHVGRADAPHAATVMALHAHGIRTGFLDAELRDAEQAPDATPKGRENLTKIPLITIDPADARDHDDAVWAAPDADPKNLGGWTVMVAIADVAAYVRPGTALDRGAEARANSCYFPDRVVPMLPERLSADLCSLREHEPRPCLAVRMVFDKAGTKRSHAFVRGWMRSAAKLTYEQAQAAIDGEPDAVAGPLLDDVLRPLWGAYATVRAARTRRAPLEIDAPERRIVLDDHGKVVDVRLRERFDAHKLVEEFMIQANVAAAETLERKKQALVYRIHDEPSKEKLQALADFLPTVGLSWNKAAPATTKRFNDLLVRARGGDNDRVVNEMVLRSQSQAVYDTENIGHFGLNLSRYAHFTSPIRRYADLLVHRALIRALSLGDDGLTDDQEARMRQIAEHISGAERKAMAAERDASDRYLAAFLSERVGATFAARITGVTRAGLFLRLADTGADGLAPISRLGRERFIHDPRSQALIGQDSGGRFRMGMAVEAKLVEATPVQGGLLFEVLTKAEPGKRPGRGRGAGPGGRPTQPRKGRKRR